LRRLKNLKFILYDNFFKFKFTQKTEFPDLKFRAIECVRCFMKNQQTNELIDLSTSDFFPKVFKYRSLNILKDNVRLDSVYE